MLKILVFTFFLSSPLSAQSIDSVRVANKAISSHEIPFGEKIVLGTLGAIAGQIIGYIAGATIAGGIIWAIGNDEYYISQIGGAIGSIIGGVAGAIIVIELRENKYKEEAAQVFTPILQISPIYDLENNGVGLGFALAF